MTSNNARQNDALVKRTKKRCILLLVFLILFAWFGVRLALTESPDDWISADITVLEVQHISRKHNLWHITDTKGNTYTANESDAAMDQVLTEGTYHILYSPDKQNSIRGITQGETVIVDRAHSVTYYCERSIWDWLLAALGIGGTLVTIVCMVTDLRKALVLTNPLGEKP